MITVENARDRFLSRLGSPAETLVSVPIGPAFDRMLGFFALEPLDITSDSADMMLFQWGIYDWHDGDGTHFGVDLTRQMIFDPGEDEDIYQLSLNYRFKPAPTLALESGNRWCRSRTELDSFREFVLRSPSIIAVESLSSFHVLLSYGPA
jgi:hypothetical protein